MKQIGTLSRTTEETKKRVVELYMQGYSQNYLEKHLHMTRKTIRTILGAAGIKRDRSQQSYYHHLNNTLREDAFDVMTDDTAYWIGFLYADGYITNPEHTHAVGILLKEDDEEHLVKFKEFMQAPQKIYHNEAGRNVKIKIGSQRLHARLQQLGFTNTKSYDAKPPEFLKYNRHFWRGVIDGDGCLGIVSNSSGRSYPRLHLCGTRDMTEGFRDFLIRSGVDTNASVRKVEGKTLHTFYVSAGLAVGAARLLYEDAKTYLTRKHEMFERFKLCF